jgi:hypothetical protein
MKKREKERVSKLAFHQKRAEQCIDRKPKKTRKRKREIPKPGFLLVEKGNGSGRNEGVSAPVVVLRG